MTRRKHENSHFGCDTCKKRKIKCDETYPQCYRCTRYNQRCPFTILSGEEITQRLYNKRMNIIKKKNRKNRKSRLCIDSTLAPSPPANSDGSYFSTEPSVSSSIPNGSPLYVMDDEIGGQRDISTPLPVPSLFEPSASLIDYRSSRESSQNMPRKDSCLSSFENDFVGTLYHRPGPFDLSENTQKPEWLLFPTLKVEEPYDNIM